MAVFLSNFGNYSFICRQKLNVFPYLLQTYQTDFCPYKVVNESLVNITNKCLSKIALAKEKKRYINNLIQENNREMRIGRPPKPIFKRAKIITAEITTFRYNYYSYRSPTALSVLKAIACAQFALTVMIERRRRSLGQI